MSDAFVTYTTVDGDTFDSISRKTTGIDTNAALIASANPGVNEPTKKGISIKIPVSKRIEKTFNDGLDIRINDIKFGTINDFVLTKAIDGFRKAEFITPNEISTRAVLPALTPLRAEIAFDNNRMLYGYLETPKPSSTQLKVELSSLPNVLDSQPTISSFPLEWKKTRLDNIAKYLCSLHDLNVFFDDDVGSRFRKVSIKRKDKTLKFLSGLCRQRTLVIGDDEFGSVLFGKADAPGAPILIIDDENRPDVIVDVEFDTGSFYSEITGVLKKRTGRVAKKYTIRNPHYRGLYKSHEFEISKSDDGELEDVTRNVTARMFAEIFKVKITVPGWTDKNGDLIEHNRRIQVRSPRRYINEYIELMIRAVTMVKKGSTFATTIECVLPGVFSGVIPDVVPWGQQ